MASIEVNVELDEFSTDDIINELLDRAKRMTTSQRDKMRGVLPVDYDMVDTVQKQIMYEEFMNKLKNY